MRETGGRGTELERRGLDLGQTDHHDSDTVSSPRPISADRLLGGCACPASPAVSLAGSLPGLAGPVLGRKVTPSASTGRKKSRCRTVWVNTYNTSTTAEATAANASWAPENSGPGTAWVNVGSTRHKVAMVATQASAAPVPSGLNLISLN